MKHLKKFENLTDDTYFFFRDLIDIKLFNFIDDKALYFSDKDHHVYVGAGVSTNSQDFVAIYDNEKKWRSYSDSEYLIDAYKSNGIMYMVKTDRNVTDKQLNEFFTMIKEKYPNAERLNTTWLYSIKFRIFK